jgi:hypothetical protein
MHQHEFAGSLNPISTFGTAPDKTLAMLEKAADYQLSIEQKVIAKMSATNLLNSAILSGRIEIDVLDLVELWDDAPALAIFSAALRKVFIQ